MLVLPALISAAVIGSLANPLSPGRHESYTLSAAARHYTANYGVRPTARASGAIPAWARKYSVNCSACHQPAVPRLNEAGMRFKWAGYRMPEEIGEVAEVVKVQNYIAGGGKLQFEYNKPEGASADVSAFSLPSVTLFYAGPVGRRFAAYFELEHGAGSEVERIGQISGLWGSEQRYGGFRVGQMHYLAEWGLAGFDRPSGISSPLAIDGSVTGAVPFALGEHQMGAELYYVRGSNRLSAQVLNGINPEGAGSMGDADTKKDFLVTDQMLIDSAGSGIQGVVYYGSLVGLDASAPAQNSHFLRLGITANKIIGNFELLATLIYGKDSDLPVGGGSPFASAQNKGIGYWLSGQYTFGRAAETPLTLFSRYESVDPNTETSADANRRFVLGAVLPINIPQYLRWALEFRRDFPQGGLPKTNNITTELMLNF